MDFTDTIKEAQSLILKDKAEWKTRYQEYAKKILGNNDVIKSLRSKFREFSTLYCYISTSKAIVAKKNLSLDVRYMGQSVATLKINQNNVTISTERKKTKNKRDFDCDIELNNTIWNDPEVSTFRKYFKNRPKIRNSGDNKNNKEHNIENLLLSEFSKRNSNNKQLLYIQPVKICDIRFSMPTPLKASNHSTLDYSGPGGGGIDILARTGTGLKSALTVIEVKDENKPNEPPKDAIKQAIQYAVFIRELLRSDCGEDWYKIFGYTRKIPEKLTIRVACAMPDDIVDKSFVLNKYLIGNDVIECHYIYFKYDGENLSNFQSSL